MSFRHPRLFWFLVSVLFSTDTLARTHPEFEFEIGHWAGQTETSSSGLLESCMVSNHNDYNELMILRLDKDRELTLGIFDTRWLRDAPSRVPSIVAVDHHVLATSSVVRFSKSVLVVQLEDVDDSLTSISKGRLISVSQSDGASVFELEDADLAIKFLRNCISTAGTPLEYKPGANPLDPRSTSLSEFVAGIGDF